MSELVKKRPCSNYTDGEITEGLTVLALCSGNSRRASEQAGIPRGTLKDWKERLYPEEYKRIEERELPKVYAEIARRCENLALSQAELEEKMTKTLAASFGEMKPAEQASALRNVAVSKAVNIDKASLVRGRPTAITERRDATELVRALAGRFGGLIRVESTDGVAVEVDAVGPSAPALSPSNAHA